MTPRILPVRNIGHWRSRYSESEKEQIKQEKQGWWKNIFVYIRRSTTNKQELSLQRQEDDAQDTIKKNGIDSNKVEYYIESKTAYDGVKEKDGKLVRKRIEFTRMLSDIDESKKPVTILTYEPSRLSRNDKDTGEILDRLFWEYNAKKRNIECIMFNDRQRWMPDMEKAPIKQALLNANAESERIGIRSSKGNIRQLRWGRYTYSTPRGIDRLKKWENTLKTNADMPYILKAWEMKADNKDKREITKYLAKYGIKINSFETYFRNSVYSGKVPDPETWELIEVKFEGGKPPISMELFNRVQKTLWIRRVSKHQEGNIITRLLKWEHDKWKNFSTYLAKGKYTTYKSNAYGGFDMSEIKLIEKVLNTILLSLFGIIEDIYWEAFNRIFTQDEVDTHFTNEELLQWRADFRVALDNLPDDEKVYKKLYRSYKRHKFALELLEQGYKLDELSNMKYSELKELSDSFTELHPNHMKYISTSEYHQLQKKCVRMGKMIAERFKWISKVQDYLLECDEKWFATGVLSREAFKDFLSCNFPLWKNYQEAKEEREQGIEALIKEKDNKKQKKIQVAKDALLNGYTSDIAESVQADIQKEIEAIDNQILALSESIDIEEFFDRLPEVLAKTFELSSRVLLQEESEVKREEVYKVIELATFELNPSNKKELKIKLFPVLEAIKKWEKCNWQGRGQTIRTFIENYDMLAEKYGEDF